MKKVYLLTLLPLLGLSACNQGPQNGLVWNEGYENCRVKFVSESNLVIGLAEVDFGALPSNTALSGNIKDAPIFTETDPSLISAKANVIAARKDDYNSDANYAKKINALCSVLKTNAQSFIDEHYVGKVSYAYENLTNFNESDDFSGEGTITVVASEAPHAEILRAIKPVLKSTYGYDLSVTVQDWSIQNNTVANKEADANYFQHCPYLEEYNSKNGDKLLAVSKIHYEPLGVYKGGKTKNTEFFNGAQIEVCNDPSNGQRALDLLVYKGYLKSYDLKALKLK